MTPLSQPATAARRPRNCEKRATSSSYARMVWGESFRIDWQWRMNADAASPNSTSSNLQNWWMRHGSRDRRATRPEFRRDGLGGGAAGAQQRAADGRLAAGIRAPGS